MNNWKKIVVSVLLGWCITGNAQVSCTRVATITETDGGIFSLEEYNNELYIGMFGYRTLSHQLSSDRMMWKYNGTSLTPIPLTKGDLLNSESVCSMTTFNDRLLIGTERDGQLFTYQQAEGFTKRNNAGQRDICDFSDDGLTVIAPQTHNGTLLKSSNGVNWSVETINTLGNPYFRESVYYKGWWYVYGIERTTNRPIGFRSKDLDAWNRINVPGRVFRTSIINNTLYLSIAAFPNYGSFDKVAIYTSIDGLTYQPYYRDTEEIFSHINTVYNVKIGSRITKVATQSSGFKPLDSPDFGLGGYAGLYEFNDAGKRIELCRFSGQEYAEATAWYNGNLYIGTMHGGYERADVSRPRGYGNLYKVSGIEETKHVDITPKHVDITPILQLLLLD